MKPTHPRPLSKLREGCGLKGDGLINSEYKHEFIYVQFKLNKSIAYELNKMKRKQGNASTSPCSE